MSKSEEESTTEDSNSEDLQTGNRNYQEIQQDIAAAEIEDEDDDDYIDNFVASDSEELEVFSESQNDDEFQLVSDLPKGAEVKKIIWLYELNGKNYKLIHTIKQIELNSN